MAQLGLLLAPSRVVHVTPRVTFGPELLVASMSLFVCFSDTFSFSFSFASIATSSLPLQLLRNRDRGWESRAQDGVDVEVDFDPAVVLEVEDVSLRVVVVVVGRSRGGEFGLEEIGEGLGDGWLVVVVIVVVGSFGRC
jgi:hypothetical protein